MKFDTKGLEPDAEWKDEWFRNKEGMTLLLLPCVYGHHVYTLNACFHANANKEMCRFCANVHANHMRTEHETVSPFLLHV